MNDGLRLADIMGSWLLKSIHAVSPDGSARTDREVAGLLIYTDSGHMSAIVQAPESLFGFPLVAYAGSFSIEGYRIIHRVLVGAEPTRPGATLVREASISHAAVETLSLTGRVNEVRTTLAWQRNPILVRDN